jgi:uncharacterized membrane protein
MATAFPDLRSGEQGIAGESFWPSFTDIMTVVVMIFLLVSTVLIVRNWELVNELRATMEAEQRAAALARTTSATNATLEEQIDHAQHQLSELRMQLMQAQEIAEFHNRVISDRDQRLSQLEQLNQQLVAALAKADQLGQDRQLEITRLQAQERQQSERIEQLNIQQREAENRQRDAELRLRQQQSDLEQMRVARSESEQQLQILQGSFNQLKVQYDKLVRPARSAAGKFVVDVRYERIDGQPRIQLRDAPNNSFVVLDRATLDRNLTQLKEIHGERLYVKVVIPESSGLTYNEAWNFMREILDNYDYYYQQPASSSSD